MCVCAEPLVRLEMGRAQRGPMERDISIPLCDGCSESLVTTSHQHETDLRKPKEDPCSPKKHSNEKWEVYFCLVAGKIKSVCTGCQERQYLS